MIEKLMIAKSILKESILNKNLNLLNDTNIYFDYLGYLDCSYSLDPQKHILKQDVSEVISFFIDNELPILNLGCINEEISKNLPKLISEGVLTNKAPYNLETLRSDLNFLSDVYYSTEEDKKLSERFGWWQFAFNKPKDNRTDLLIFICAKRNNIKIIITSNYPDFIWCNDIYSTKINPDDKEEILILTPAEMYQVIKEMKKEIL